jgi:hypothetical protein
MSTDNYTRKNRPFLAAVIDNVDHANEAPLTASTQGLFAIAYALLDVADAIRSTKETE